MCSLETVLSKEESDIAVLRFLDAFNAWAGQQQKIDARAVQAWIVGHRAERFEVLSLTKSEDTDALIALAMKHGGIDLLERT